MSEHPVDFVLAHDGQYWIARHKGLAVRARTPSALDQALVRQVREMPDLRDKPLKLTLRFDMSTLPHWLHQYAGHYFNRVITLTPQRTDDAGDIGAAP